MTVTLQPQIAVELEASATKDTQVTDRRRRAIYRGDYYTDEHQVLDTSGVAFNLGPTDDPWYTPRIQFRNGPASQGYPVLYDGVATITDGPAGVIEWYATSDGTRRLTEDLTYYDVEIENVSDDRFPIGAVFTVVRVKCVVLGDFTRSTDLEGDGSEDSDAESSPAAIDSATTVYSSGVYGEVSLVDGVYDGELRTRSIAGEQGVKVELVENTVVVKRRPTLYAPLSRSSLIGYRPEPFCSRRTAGEADDTYLADNHQDDEAGGTADDYNTAAEYANNTPPKWGYPYMVCGVSVDTYGLPHNDHRRMRGSSSLIPRSGLFGRRLVGYEMGVPLRRGDFTRGRKVVWELTGAMENVGYTDAFVDFCLDINPDCTAGTYATTHRMRMSSGNRAFWTWTGEALFRGRVELVSLGLEGHAYHGEFHLFDPTSGGHMDSWQVGNKVSSGYDWLAGQGLTAYLTVGSQTTSTATLAVDTGTCTIEKGARVAVLISGVYYTATVTANYVGGTGSIAVGGWSAPGVSISAGTAVYVRRDTATLQLRYRVDRDWLARADTFDDTYQGTNQGANTLRLHVDRLHVQYIGFRDR